MSLRQVGLYPTPFGVEVPVFEDPHDKEAVLFDAQGTSICMGIFDERDRKRFVDDAVVNGRMDISRPEHYGGVRLLHVKLPQPIEPVYPELERANAKEPGFREPLEAIVTTVMDTYRWSDRASRLLEVVEVNMAAFAGNALTEMVETLALQLIMTGALEHVAESEIDCVEAAAFYALTAHEDWRKAGLEWLKPVRRTWFRQWRDARPAYQRFAASCSKDTDLPAWISGRSS